jgi:transposase
MSRLSIAHSLVLRYELSKAQWLRQEGIVAAVVWDGGASCGGRKALCERVLWLIRPGLRWADLPERYGKYKSMRRRFLRWVE